MPLQQQQLLYNGKEIRNAEKLSGLGVSDGDLVMMVAGVSQSRCLVCNLIVHTALGLVHLTALIENYKKL